MRSAILFIASTAAVVAAVGCSSTESRVPRSEQLARPVSVAKSDTKPKPKPIDLAKVKPNELGKVMILEYHEVGDTEGRWERHYDNFRKDLQRLYDLGYRPVSLRNYVENNIDLPPGKAPVVFTFDDATQGQFNYLYADQKPKVDPNCAVAIMEDFHSRHPDWPLEATFYVYYPVPFRQRELIGRKLQHIVDQGMDIGNHTYTHTRLDLDSDASSAKEIALNVKSTLDYAPKATIDSIALPYGKGPRNPSVLKSGEFDGQKYTNIAALLVGAEPAPSSVSREFDPYRLPRIQAIQSELDTWISYFKKHPEMRYVSDGDPDTVTVPKESAGEVDKSRLGPGKTLRSY